MKINPTSPVPYELPRKPNVNIKVAPRLFDANGEVRVGDVVHFNKKPCYVERIGELVTIVTMNERKYSFCVLPHQIGCVLQKGDKR